MELIEMINKCTADDAHIYAPSRRIHPLDGNDYAKLKAAIEKAGGKWVGRQVQGWKFEGNKAAQTLERLKLGDNVNAKKESQFYQTSKDLAVTMAKQLNPVVGGRYLEPSAGRLRLVNALVNRAIELDIAPIDITIDVCENDDLNLNYCMERSGSFDRIICKDFLKIHDHIDDDLLYDGIIANPPFSKMQYIHHIIKMLTLVKPGGRIVTLAWPGFANGTTRLEGAMRETLGIPFGANFNDWNASITFETKFYQTIVIPIKTHEFKAEGTMIKPWMMVIDVVQAKKSKKVTGKSLRTF